MNKQIVLLAVLFLAACPPPPPPPPITTTVVPTTTTTSVPTTTTTTVERKPEDYIALARGERIIHDVEVESRSEIWLDIWHGIRHEEYAATHCYGIVEGVLGRTPEELVAMAYEGRKLIDEWNRHWKENLSTVNRRCENEFASFLLFEIPMANGFCDRSNVLKENWAPYLERLKAHRLAANQNQARAVADAVPGCPFDNVMGWCQCREKFPK